MTTSLTNDWGSDTPFILQSAVDNSYCIHASGGYASSEGSAIGIDALESTAEVTIVWHASCDPPVGRETKLSFQPLDAGTLDDSRSSFLLQSAEFPTHCVAPASGTVGQDVGLVWKAGACQPADVHARFTTIELLDGAILLQSVADPTMCVHPFGASVANDAALIFYPDCTTSEAHSQFRRLFIQPPALPSSTPPLSPPVDYHCTNNLNTFTDGVHPLVFTNASMEDCKAACAANHDCVVLVHNIIGNCYVKTGAIIRTAADDPYNGTTSCVPSGLGRAAAQAFECPALGDVHGYSADVVTTVSQCRSWCEASAACTSYDFSPLLSRCTLSTCPLAEVEDEAGRGLHLDFFTCAKPEWLAGVTTAIASAGGATCDGVLSACVSSCAADPTCDYVVDETCNSALFDAVGGKLIGVAKPTGARYGSTGGVARVTDSNGYSGYDTTAGTFHLVPALDDPLTYPTPGWDSTGSVAAPQPPGTETHCILKKPAPPQANQLSAAYAHWTPSKVTYLPYNLLRP